MLIDFMNLHNLFLFLCNAIIIILKCIGNFSLSFRSEFSVYIFKGPYFKRNFCNLFKESIQYRSHRFS